MENQNQIGSSTTAEQNTNNNAIVEKASQPIVDKMKDQSLSFFNPQLWQGINLMAKTFFSAGALPKALDSAPKVIMALQAGSEAGMKPLEALQCFAPINGKMTMYGDALISQVSKAGHKITWGECNNEKATVTVERGDNGSKMTETYTIDDAERAGLATRDVWKKYTKRMLKYKVFAEVAHFIAADALRGVIVRELADEYEEKPKENRIKKVKAEQITASTPINSLEAAIDTPDPKPEEKIIEEMPVNEKPKKRSRNTIIKDIKALAKAKNKDLAPGMQQFGKSKIEDLTVFQLLAVEEALIKSVVTPAVTSKNNSYIPQEKENEGKGAKAMRKAMEKNKKEAEDDKGKWPDDICKYLRFVEDINDEELPDDILQLKKDANSGFFNGYEKYPSLQEQIEKMPKDFK